MTNEQVLFRLTDRCDIYFENSLISKERIIKKYADFFTSSISNDGHSVSVALHTGSVCFDIVSFITAALACVSLDETDAESIIASLNVGNMVLYRNERYRWCGSEFRDGKQYLVLEQDGRGKNGKTTIWVLFDTNKSLIRPYFGASDVTDGRGIKRKDTNRADFISHILGVAASEVPSITGVSTVIVAERGTFDRLSKGIRIVYGNGKNIGLLDIVTASYFSDSGEEYLYGSNPAKTEPVLKITGKVSTARDLVLDKRGNKTVGLIITGADAAAKGGSELIDLLGRKSIKFAHIAAGIDSECAEGIIESQEDASVFACTKEFLLQNSLPPQETNALTVELDRQIENIVNNSVTTIFVDGGCSWEDLRKAREALYIIKKSEWNDAAKNSFLITSHSLLNLFTTAVFPIEVLEKAVKGGKLITGISSPALRIRELWNLADNSESVKYQCAYIIDVLECLYQSGFVGCPKHDALNRHLDSSVGQKIAVIVPKAYYIDILGTDETLNRKDVTIVTANRFDNSDRYDEVIVVGDFSGKRFDPLKCRAAADITVLLYECEMHWFKHKKRKAVIFENRLNSRLGVIDDDTLDDVDSRDGIAGDEDMDAFTEEVVDLEQYIGKISSFDIGKYVARVSGSAGNTLTSEVYAIGRFVSGEQILFSKYYNAVVFDSIKGTVIETDVDDLSAGDQLVFTKRDDYTRNMVDYIYESLQTAGRLSAEVLDATEKSVYWKEALREYKHNHGFSYRDISRELQKLGSSLQEVSVRQWLIEESHIVGPRDEITLQQIAVLTQDSYLLCDTHSYFEACRIVRHQRKEILELIGKAITDKLSGHKPPKGGVLEVVYDNVESLSETLELDGISLLEETVTVPINLINKPITYWEVIE
ncbi:MAG: hypothetical protein JL50_16200 [Peptococcaceae bacterium BICA1-7]|nr:MAG: hypothetical protein JL50_16200 [Peptococcaceae bacterium BICA1-7]HBV96666.1 hypothetical protein [Desulfotomaculum sp.]